MSSLHILAISGSLRSYNVREGAEMPSGDVDLMSRWRVLDLCSTSSSSDESQAFKSGPFVARSYFSPRRNMSSTISVNIALSMRKTIARDASL